MYNHYGMSNEHSGMYDGLQPAPPTASYGGQYAPPPGIYAAPKAEYEMNYRPRYHSTVGLGADAPREQIPSSIATQFARRASVYGEPNSGDSGLSGLSIASTESKLSNDSGYASQGFYNNSFRETSHIPQQYTIQPDRSLPSPNHQPSYERPQYERPHHSYGGVDGSSLKENMWSVGNASAGHGHYIAPHQQWATGTS